MNFLKSYYMKYIDQVVVDQFFTGTASRIRGIGLEEIAQETLIRHRAAYAPGEPLLESGGLVPDGLLTHTMGLGQVREALGLMDQGLALKVLIEPSTA